MFQEKGCQEVDRENDTKLAEAELQFAEAKEAYEKANGEFDFWCEKKREDIEMDIEEKYPLPPRPIKPKRIDGATIKPDDYDIHQASLGGMVRGKRYSITELQNQYLRLRIYRTSRYPLKFAI